MNFDVWVQIPTLTLNNCENLIKTLGFSLPQLLHVSNEEEKNTSHMFHDYIVAYVVIKTTYILQTELGR